MIVPGRNGSETKRVAAVQREFGDVAHADGFRDARVVRLDGRGGALDIDRLGHVADPQRNVIPYYLVDVDVNTLDLIGLKSGMLDR